jgi:7-keto-8-aminopelargonate synthetase-like enzyme
MNDLFARLRITVTAAHSEEQIESLAEAIKRLCGLK